MTHSPKSPWLSLAFGLLLCLGLALASLTLAPTPALAESVSAQGAIVVINDLEDRAILPPPVATAQRQYYQTHPTAFPPSLWSRVQGVVTFANVIWVLASLLLVAALAWLGGLYFLALLMAVPLVVYEALAYGCSLGLMIYSPSEFGALPGCLGFAGTWAWSTVRHHDRLQPLYQRWHWDPIVVYSTVLTLVWGAATLWQQSTVLGFITVIALEACVGFFIGVMPGVYSLGFRSRDLVPRAVIVSLGLLLAYVPLSQGWIQWSPARLFQPGVLFVGTFVYYIGLLIWSAKWYGHDRPRIYGILQGFTILSGIAALYLGSLWGIQQLQGIGGTFFGLYLLEKYFELPWGQKSLAWATLGLALLLGTLAGVMRHYPQYFLV